MIKQILTLTAVLYIQIKLIVRIIASLMLWNDEKNRQDLLKELNAPSTSFILGFFHPFCNAGGGGERVLWTAIRDVQTDYPDIISVVYTGDTDASKNEILEKVRTRFHINLDEHKLAFVYLHKRYMVEDSQWPHFTLLGQSIGSLFLGWEAMSKLKPDVYIDTMGYAFTFPLVSILCNIPVTAYVHYPTISTDMIGKIQGVSNVKLIYYRLFAMLYSIVGRYATVVMVNSSWTRDHIQQLWKGQAHVVFPPCDTEELEKLPLGHREDLIISISQFRPEKQHKRQVESFAIYARNNPKSKLRLVMLGSSRNEADERRIQELKDLAQKLGLSDRVELVINAPFPKLKEWLGRAKLGLNVMWNEHFGIGCVEFMAAGVIPIVHASGGPKYDIVVPYNGVQTGYHADTNEEFADAIEKAMKLSSSEQSKMASTGRALASNKFSEKVFKDAWLQQMSPLFSKKQQ